MEIKEFDPKYIWECADLMLQTYNCAPWNDNWTKKTAEKYLTEFILTPRFVGFILIEDSKLAGAIFCHEQTWWTKDEIYIDEFFVSPEHQNKGYGKALIKSVEQYLTFLYRVNNYIFIDYLVV